MKIHSLFLSLVLILSGLTVPLLPLYAADENDRFVALEQEALSAKEKRAENLSTQTVVLQKQIDQDRKEAKAAQDRLWKEFSGSLEIERKGVKDRLEIIDERQQLFEKELAKKKEQDELRTREKEEELKSLMLDAERIRLEILEDRKRVEEHIQQLKKTAEEAKKVQSGPPPVQDSGEASFKLKDEAIRMATVDGRQFLGEAAGPPKSLQSEYFIELGDVIGIEVWRVPDVSKTVTVRPDGRISLPLVGDLDVVGMTLVELKQILTKRYADFIRNPQVSISIQQFGGRKFIMMGQVRSPGVYRFTQDISLLEAIALAGGFTEEARRGRVMIIRGDLQHDPQVKMISANVEKIITKGILTENLRVLPNDIIYVGRDFLGDYNSVMKDLINPSLNTVVNFFVTRSAIRTAQDKRN